MVKRGQDNWFVDRKSEFEDFYVNYVYNEREMLLNQQVKMKQSIIPTNTMIMATGWIEKTQRTIVKDAGRSETAENYLMKRTIEYFNL